VQAQGCRLFSRSGKAYFDGTGGSGAVNLGHQHPRVVAAIIQQCQKLTHTGWNLQSQVRTELVRELGAFAPYQDCAVLFTVTGSEAIEAALKVARAYTGRDTVIAFDRSYHGKTGGSLLVTWRERFRKYSPVAAETVSFAPFPLLHLPGPAGQPAYCLEALQNLVAAAWSAGCPPAALILEPIQAAEGILPGGRDFLAGVLQVARKCGSLVIFDEIYTGFGRCGTPFYGSREGLTPDLLVVGKSLGNGLPVSAVLGPARVLNVLPPGFHTSTFAGHPLACRAALAVLEVMEQEKPWQQAAALGLRVFQFLQDQENRSEVIAGVRGEGMMLGFDCVDQGGQPSASLSRALVEEALARGLVLRCGGFTGATVKLTPPLIIPAEDMDFLLAALAQAIAAIRKR
jgi:4-aminobutyrate aminotransferase/(S)-3-amino-2-methylpropionate transaminase